jgi:hypothetical protein
VKTVSQVRQHPYSPDVIPCHFLLLPKYDSRERQMIVDMETVEHNAREQMLAIPKTEFRGASSAG